MVRPLRNESLSHPLEQRSTAAEVLAAGKENTKWVVEEGSYR